MSVKVNLNNYYRDIETKVGTVGDEVFGSWFSGVNIFET
ncbi:hypothetical protein BCO_0900106 (plasmid) [Borrelia coriaceae ATCC 43381]|uniref:Uncharacterized protein n=1 Tax=Borrelia coriaceae ATCC 43381 TaxID=1408429 RepID=W5SY11_9SPIR|nr:hypothetical protein BCO_0900106 [Borrelia coriaceae ATCC 43381]